MMPIVHAIFAYALSYFSGAYALFAITGAILPDIDTVFVPYREIHRTFLHTPVAGLILAAVLYYLIRNRKIAASFFMGWVSHLFLDTLTVTGIMWKYPFSREYFTTATFRSIELMPNFGIALLSVFAIALAILFSRGRMKELKKHIKAAEHRGENSLAVLFFILVMLAFGLFFVAQRGEFPKIENSVLISKLLEQQEKYDGRYVAIAGVVDEIRENYTSRGIAYQIFAVDDGTAVIQVYKSAFVPP
ncbi:MAG: metal-dependent hydrolase, partial [Candidatus Aenigmarchaeota archaeon]|nr:metal-dependent hydrolase [Candidatus Aenigmarchaeota archaeon]